MLPSLTISTSTGRTTSGILIGGRSWQGEERPQGKMKTSLSHKQQTTWQQDIALYGALPKKGFNSLQCALQLVLQRLNTACSRTKNEWSSEHKRLFTFFASAPWLSLFNVAALSQKLDENDRVSSLTVSFFVRGPRRTFLLTSSLAAGFSLSLELKSTVATERERERVCVREMKKKKMKDGDWRGYGSATQWKNFSRQIPRNPLPWQLPESPGSN